LHVPSLGICPGVDRRNGNRAGSAAAERDGRACTALRRPSSTEATEVAILLGTRPFVLVTSPNHIPRAMLLMRREGAQSIAPLTGQRAYETILVALYDFPPGSGGLRASEPAMYEYAGLAAIAQVLE
jgi:hypothetical protein